MRLRKHRKSTLANPILHLIREHDLDCYCLLNKICVCVEKDSKPPVIKQQAALETLNPDDYQKAVDAIRSE